MMQDFPASRTAALLLLASLASAAPGHFGFLQPRDGNSSAAPMNPVSTAPVGATSVPGGGNNAPSSTAGSTAIVPSASSATTSSKKPKGTGHQHDQSWKTLDPLDVQMDNLEKAQSYAGNGDMAAYTSIIMSSVLPWPSLASKEWQELQSQNSVDVAMWSAYTNGATAVPATTPASVTGAVTSTAASSSNTPASVPSSTALPSASPPMSSQTGAGAATTPAASSAGAPNTSAQASPKTAG